MKKIILFALSLLILCSCEDYLDISPDDKITDGTFWDSKSDADLALNGVYNSLQDWYIFGYGPGLDACTPNAYQWTDWEGQHMQVGNGSIYAGSGGIVSGRWTGCYSGIYRANYFLANVDRVPNFDTQEKEVMKGEVYLLRAIFYDQLVKTYGGVPVFTHVISAEEGRNIPRNTAEEVWTQVHSDYDEAIKRLPKDASSVGRLTLGSAYGMKMKSYLYTSQWDKVLEYCDKIDELNKYSLYPSYQGLFQYENEGNAETLVAVCYMGGPNDQGSYFDRGFQPQNLKHGMDGANSVAPTQLLVDEYETIDGSPIDPNDPYKNRDPRLDFTVLRPGAYFQGQLYPDEIKNHTGQRVGFSMRKYLIETMDVVAYESPLDFMVLRYADVLLCRAEAMIELNQNIDKAIDIINRIRTERTDVKMFTINKGLSQTDARKVLRHERRIELAMEGQYWDDVKRWKIGAELYPCTVISGLNDVIEVKFPNGYKLEKDNLLPISDSELSLNKSLVQNPGY